METKKKFTFGLKKTNYMVLNTGKEVEEEINEKVKGGTVSKTGEYKYVGLWVSEKGDCELHISKKAQKIQGDVKKWSENSLLQMFFSFVMPLKSHVFSSP